MPVATASSSGAEAELSVLAESSILDGVKLGAVSVVGAAGAAGFGLPTVSTGAVVTGGAGPPYSMLDRATGAIVVGSLGLTVVPDASSGGPRVSAFDVVVVAHPDAAVTVAAAEAVLLGNSVAAKRASMRASGGRASGRLTILGLDAGRRYATSAHAYDATWGVVATKVLPPWAAIAAPVLSPGILVAGVSLSVLSDAATIESALVPSGAAAGATRSWTVTGPATISYAESNLTPGAAHDVVAVARDAAGSVYSWRGVSLSTRPKPTVSITAVSRGFGTFDGRSDAVTSVDGVRVSSAVVPATAAAVDDFVLRGASPLGPATSVLYPSSGAYSSFFSFAGLTPGVQYTAVSVAEPVAEPAARAVSTLAAGTSRAPTVRATLSLSSLGFFDASAAIDADGYGSGVTVYAAIHPAADTGAIAKMMVVGTTAYPGSTVVVSNGLAPVATSVERHDLAPGGTYRVTAAVVSNAAPSTIIAVDYATFALPSLPSISISPVNRTGGSVSVLVTTTATADHKVVVHATPRVVGGLVLYSAAAVAALPAGGDTMLIPGGPSHAVTADFLGLSENAETGVVAVATQVATGRVLAEASVAMRTAALPKLTMRVASAGCDDVSFEVVAVDLDGPFRLLTAVSTVPYTDALASQLVTGGMSYSGPGAVPGTIDDVPWAGTGSTSVSHSGLSDGTAYSAVAVAVDPTGAVRWAQQAFWTEHRPAISVMSLSTTSHGVSADVLVVHPGDVDVVFGAHLSPAGIDASLLLADPRSTTVRSAGSGPRVVKLTAGGLAELTMVYLVAVAVSLSGCRSLLSVSGALTKRTPVADIVVDAVGITAVEATLTVDAAGVPSHDELMAILPYGDRGMLSSAVVAGLFSRAPPPGWAVEMPVSTASATPFRNTFRGVASGSRVTVLGAAMRRDAAAELSYDTEDVWTRVAPGVMLSPVSALTRGASCSVTMLYADPDSSRANSATLSVSVVSPGGATAWLGGATSGALNPDVAGAAVEAWTGGAVSAAPYSTAGLSPGTDYEMVAVAADAYSTTTEVVRFRTRAVPALAASVVSQGASGGRLGIQASLSDGVFDMYVDVAMDTGAPPDAAAMAAVVAGGSMLASATPFVATTWDAAGLPSNTAYYFLVVLVDGASGERTEAAVPFTTSCVPPTISVRPGAVAGATRATLTVAAGDLDSGCAVYARAFAAPGASVVDASVVAAVRASPDFSTVLRASPSGATLRVDLSGLSPATRYRLVAVAVDAVDGAEVHDYEDFATTKLEDNLDRAEYDGGYVLRWRSSAVYRGNVRGAALASSKVSMRAGLGGVLGEAIGTSVAGRMDYHPFGGTSNGTAPGFATGGAWVSEPRGAAASPFAADAQSLDMRAGIARTTGKVAHASGPMDAENEAMVLRHMPMCVLNFYRLTPSGAGVTEAELCHEVLSAPGIDSPAYGSITVMDPASGRPVKVLRAEGVVRGTTHHVAAAMVYLFAEPPPGASVEHVGYNSTVGGDRAVDTHVVRSLAGGATLSWATLSAHATSSDFPRPLEEITRMLLHAASSAVPGAWPHSVALGLRAGHVSAWGGAWRHSLSLAPKAGLTSADEQAFLSALRALRVAQFRLYSAAVDGGGGLGPDLGSSPGADPVGSRELWLAPALLYTRPRAVRAMLEEWFDSLRAARALAAVHGRRGAMYRTLFSRAPYWDVGSGACLYSSALVATAAWDYFRATTDRDWLAGRGYAILSAVADLVCSSAEIDPSTGRAVLRGVTDVSGRAATNPSFTMVTCRSALRAAIESAYELRYPVRQEWPDVYSGMVLEVDPATRLVSHPAGQLDVLEPLMALHPQHLSEYLRNTPGPLDQHAALLSNVAHYSSRVSPGFADNPYNTLLRAAVYAQVSRATGSHSGTAASLLLKAIADSECDIWGDMTASPSAADNDRTLCAMLVLTVMTAMAGVRVSGGVARSGFYYEPMGVRAASVSYLPKQWKSLSVTAGDGRVWNVINRALYP